jgi:hypothetical protein
VYGIRRIRIDSDWHDWRTHLANDLSSAADDIYRQSFLSIGVPLASGTEVVSVTKEEAQSRYDWQEGIDVILSSESGARMTLQEKYLTYWQSTATFEEKKTSGAQGAWYYCTAQYYFVGYARKYWDYKSRKVIPNPIMEFQDWILLDFPAIRRSEKLIQWGFDNNDKDKRRATFRFAEFNKIPENCIVAKMGSRP